MSNSDSYNAIVLNQILSNFSKGNKIESFNKLKKFIKKYPKNNIARYNFGYMCEILNNKELAIANYKKVISNDQNHWQSRFNLYLIYLNQQQYTLALKLVNEVLKIKKNYQPAQRDKALILNYLNKPDEAIILAKNSIKQNSEDYVAYNTMGLILIALKKYEEAEKIFLQAIKINSNYISSYNNLGYCYTLLDNKKKSLECFLKSQKLNPDSYEVKNNLANYYLFEEEYKKALELYFDALKFNPNNTKILYNIAIAYFNLDNDKEAEKYYKQSYALNPLDEVLLKNYSLLLLKQQRYKNAWLFFEGRLKLQEFSSKNSNVDNVKEKLWKGNSIEKNKKILVVKEQGVGDEILYGSMYPDLIRKFPNVLIESDKRLISLFDRSFNNNKKNKFFPYSTYSGDKKELKNFDAVVYAGSLGKLFRNNIDDFSKNNFLSVDSKKYSEIQSMLNKIDNKPKIGISWRSKRKQYGEAKSIDLDLLKPILQLKQFTFINLQYGETKLEILEFNKKNNANIITFNNIDLFNDFESIAALLKNLNLFITVSNSTTHLAGALGVPTWLIKPKNHATFHYWNQPNNNTPWYSSIKIFSSQQNSTNTIANIKRELLKKF